MVLLTIFALFSCSNTEPEVAAVLLPTPSEHLQVLDTQLLEIVAVWESGDQAASQEQLQRLYLEHFEPMEESLKAHDFMTTLSLEYDFGICAKLMKGNDKQRVSEHVQGLRTSLQESVAIIASPELE